MNRILRIVALVIASTSAAALAFGIPGCSGDDTDTSDSGTSPDGTTSGDDSSFGDVYMPGDTSPPPAHDSGSSDGGATDGTSPVDGGPTSPEGGEGGVNDASGADGASDGSAGEGAPPGDAGLNDAGCPVGMPVSLTVMNYLNWCSVSIQSGAASSAAVQTACVAAGTISIAATPASSSFVIGTNPWFGTDQNDGGPAQGVETVDGGVVTTTATVTVSSGSRCLSVCCGDAPDGGNCPSTNPCP